MDLFRAGENLEKSMSMWSETIMAQIQKMDIYTVTEVWI
jgi:hypothetical protein